MKPKTKFEFNGHGILLTYRSHLQGGTLAKMANSMGALYDAVHEESDKEHPYLHTHVQVWFLKKKHIRNSRYFDILGEKISEKSGEMIIHPNIKKIRTKIHWKNCITYIRKQNSPFVETLTGHEWEYLGSSRTLIQECTSWAEVVNSEELEPILMKHLNWAKEVFNNKPNLNTFNLVEEYGSFLPWQETAIKKLHNQDKRKVLWISDTVGDSGKSELSDHLEDNDQALVLEGGKFADIAYLWQGQKTIVFDLMRCNEDFIPYKAIEAFKKGRMNSTKYQPVRKRFGSCKVIVFANFMPDKAKLSSDRWDIQHLVDNKLTDDAVSNVVPQGLNIKRPCDKLRGERIHDLLHDWKKTDNTANNTVITENKQFDYV